MDFIANIFTENPWLGLVLVGIIIGMIVKSR